MKKFSGAYGIVIALDQKTVEAAQELVKDVSADFKTAYAHITLFHTKLKDADPESLKMITEKCHQLMQGQHVTLDRIAVFGSNFLFWDALPSAALTQAHAVALELAEFLDQDLHTHTKGEALTLTPGQEHNIRTYGHPLVKDDYRPHVTLAYNHSGFPSTQEHKSVLHEAIIEKVVFAEIGQFGRVLREIHLRNSTEPSHEMRRRR